MPRICLAVEYDGSRFCGWQRQSHCESVQQALETALSRIADEAITVHCAGRTDAGVHATAQIVHFDSSAARDEAAWVLGCNSQLPHDICVHWAVPVDDAFHARFAAEERHYRYLVLNSRSRRALMHARAWVVYEPLDAAAMQRAAAALLGEHDFSAFRAAGCQARHARRAVRLLDVRRHGAWVVIDIAANAFLHHMVRNITGALVAVGRGDAPESAIATWLAARERTLAPATAPAAGLYLTAVHYPADWALPAPSQGRASAPLLPLIPEAVTRTRPSRESRD